VIIGITDRSANKTVPKRLLPQLEYIYGLRPTSREGDRVCAHGKTPYSPLVFLAFHHDGMQIRERVRSLPAPARAAIHRSIACDGRPRAVELVHSFAGRSKPIRANSTTNDVGV